MPRSRTGLSGLSLGTSRNNSVFRKDLFQTFSPLIIDPLTMTATVKTSIRIPEDAFPTITQVPGAMISFRYYVEIVIDLRGKLTAQNRFPWLNMMSSSAPSGPVVDIPGQTGGPNSANLSGHILDTDPIRREKGVVAILFEVVVGTRDSSRKLRPNIDEHVLANDTINNSHPATYDVPDSYAEQPDGRIDGEGQYDGDEYYQEDEYYNYEETADWTDQPPSDNHYYGSLEGPLQPPETEPEPEDEKARLQRAEQMLLPSQPPGDPGAGPSTAVPTPTAPEISEDDYVYGHHTSAGRTIGAAALSSGPSVDTIVPGPSQNQQQSGGSPDHDRTEDKQELERRRLMMEASGPAPAHDGNIHHDEGVTAIPSAPVLEEDDELGALHVEADESLPQYQR